MQALLSGPAVQGFFTSPTPNCERLSWAIQMDNAKGVYAGNATLKQLTEAGKIIGKPPDSPPPINSSSTQASYLNWRTPCADCKGIHDMENYESQMADTFEFHDLDKDGSYNQAEKDAAVNAAAGHAAMEDASATLQPRKL